MLEYVRVKDVATGHQLSVSRQFADAYPDGLEVLDKPAVDSYGRVLSPKLLAAHQRRTVEAQAAPDEQADDSAESSNTETPEEG